MSANAVTLECPSPRDLALDRWRSLPTAMLVEAIEGAARLQLGRDLGTSSPIEPGDADVRAALVLAASERATVALTALRARDPERVGALSLQLAAALGRGDAEGVRDVLCAAVSAA